jgi:hypothetical protein
VAVKVPSSDILAVGMSIKPVMPKSDAQTGHAATTDRKTSMHLYIDFWTSAQRSKKGIKDALLYPTPKEIR